MTTRPSESGQGRQWLANFRRDERQAAALLVDSLWVISSSRFRVVMSDALESAVNDCPGPVGVYPVRALSGDDAGQFLPLDQPFTATPGSEGLVGNIIRDVIGRKPRFDRASFYDSLESLRRHKVRTLLLVDDYSGTGDRIVRYVDEWMSHPTIRSWHSYGLVRVHVLLLAASARARQRLKSHRFVASVRYLERGLGFDTAPWTDEERENVEALCRRYAHRSEFALGYGETRGLLALHHTVPNNIPHILWQVKCPRIPSWQPFFANRIMSPKLQEEIGNYRLETDLKRITAIIRQERLGAALDAQANPTVRNFLMVLAAIENGHRDPERLGGLLSFSMETTRHTLEACQALNLLDSANRLTDEGRAELRRARNRPPVPEPEPPAVCDGAPYYPLSLRGVT
ncbi:hypothetical protein [Amycolatopsis sp. WGS_07]|uniref:phosphoribosyltransferase-like protein n=1 Tax=Amycolatopsis sp. WGS_07 TaxID=3076764 RepID=UPI0038736911